MVAPSSRATQPHRIEYSDVLGEQMAALGRAAERRLAELKARQQALERKLYSIDEKTAAAAFVVEEAVDMEGGGAAGATSSGGGEGALGLEQAAREAYLRYKQVREKAAAAVGAEQRARAGLQHVAEILGVLPVSFVFLCVWGGDCRRRRVEAPLTTPNETQTKQTNRWTAPPPPQPLPPAPSPAPSTSSSNSRRRKRCRSTRWCTRWRPRWTCCGTSWSGSSTRSSPGAGVEVGVGAGGAAAAGCSCTRPGRGTSR